MFKNAAWIMAENPETDSYYDYKQPFTVTDKNRVTLYISAHTNYAVYINGQFVDCGQLPDFEDRKIYDELDITDYVNQGVNELLVTQQYVGAPFMTTTVQIPGVIFALYEGEKELAVSTPATLSGKNTRYISDNEKITHQLGFTWNYDANGCDTLFAPSVPANKDKELLKRPVKKLTIGKPQASTLLAQGAFLENDPSLPKSKRMQTAWLSSLTKRQLTGENGWCLPDGQKGDGIYLVYDLGGETIGYPYLELTVDKETEILVGYGEHLEDLRVRSACGYRHFCFRYVAKPGKNRFFHPFRRIGLRYMQLHIYNRSVCVDTASICPTRYPMARKPVPVTDGFHKKLWQTASKTLDLCMQDYFCDCIWREQSMYAYDGRMELLACYYGFDAPEFAREALRICAQHHRDDGLLEMCAPGTEPSNTPQYSAMYLRGIWEYTQYTGDETLVREVMPVMQTIARTFADRITEKNLVPLFIGTQYWPFYEWQPGMDGKIWGTTTREPTEAEDYDLPLNFYIADGFRCFGWLCERLGMDGKQYSALSQRLKQGLHQHFFRQQLGGYVTRLEDTELHHETVQGMMLYLDAVPEAHIRSVEQLIRSKSLLRPTLGLSVYVYEGMLLRGENRDFVLEDMEQRWGRMLLSGTDTFWETERGPADFSGAGALCQGWSSIPLYLFGKYFS